MLQQGQVFPLKTGHGRRRWAYRYRVAGRGSKRVQRGGFASEQAAAEALERALEETAPGAGAGGDTDAGRVRRRLSLAARG